MQHAEEMQTATGRPDRTLVILVSIVAAVVILALVVVFTRGTPAPLDPTSPEGTVQAYTVAVLDGDRESATALLTRELRDGCERLEPDPTLDIRLTLVSTKVSGDRAVVRVSIANDYGGGPFAGGSYETEESFVLLRDGGDWLVDTAPWQLTICYDSGSGQ